MIAAHRARPRLLAGCIGLATAAALLRAGASGDLDAPPITSLEALLAWADAHPPATLAVALVRTIAEVTTWYLLVVLTIHVIASLVPVPGGRRVADAVTLPWIRGAVHATLGIGMVASTTIGIRAAPVGVPIDRIETAVPIASRTPVEPDLSGTATMRPAAVASEGGTARMAPVASTWTVAGGESMWTIAEETLTEAWGRPVADAEVAPYWLRLIEVNRSRLVDPDDPDLIHPGQRFDLPAIHDTFGGVSGGGSPPRWRGAVPRG